MTRCYIDTNFLYVHLRQRDDPNVLAWRERLQAELAEDAGVISALVLDELAYRLVLAWLRDDGDPDPMTTLRTSGPAVMREMGARLNRLWKAVDDLSFEQAATDGAVTRRAKRLMSDPGLVPRDAFHAAHAFGAACTVIASSDSDYDRVRGLRRLGPTEAAAG